MKTLSILIALASFNLHAKTCTASLKGDLKKQDFYFPFTKVFYPDAPGHSRQANWDGPTVTKEYIAPAPITIECGKPYFEGSFEALRGTVMLPPSITTQSWTTVDWSGKPRVVDPEVLYGLGDSEAYPYPSAFLNSSEEIKILAPVADGTTDICDVTSLPLANIPVKAKIETDYLTTWKAYTAPSVWGDYRWDNFSTPINETIDVEIENAEIIISCDASYKYEATFEWPYVIPADDESMCGPGSVHRSMKIEGVFSKSKDNKLAGNLIVSKPEVTYTGTVTGEYNGKGFTIPTKGMLISDTEKSKVYLPTLQGGDGISWSYVLTCPFGEIRNTLFAAVSNYFMIMNDQETPSADQVGFLEYDSESDVKTFTVDMGGQGTVTIHRSWKKVETP